MTHFNTIILSNWILSGYKYVMCSHRPNRIILRPLKTELDEENVNGYIIPIGDEQLKEMCSTVDLLENVDFVCDTSDIE